jgi:hypothetical protein
LLAGIGAVRLVGSMENGGALADVSIFTTGRARKTSAFCCVKIAMIT